MNGLAVAVNAEQSLMVGVSRISFVCYIASKC